MKKFEMPEIEIVVFAVQDVITSSGNIIDEGEPGDDNLGIG